MRRIIQLFTDPQAGCHENVLALASDGTVWRRVCSDYVDEQGKPSGHGKPAVVRWVLDDMPGLPQE